MDKRIARKIAVAQYASDIEKGIFDEKLESLLTRAEKRRARHEGYVLKSQLIRELCYDIAHNKHTGFRFWWATQPGTYSIVYFEFKIEGTEYQVSFHNPGTAYRTWLEGSKPFSSRWDRLDSRAACIKLLEYVSTNQ